MSDYVRVLCTECRGAIRIESERLPEGLQPDEMFEGFCGRCDRSVFMKLDQEKEGHK